MPFRPFIFKHVPRPFIFRYAPRAGVNELPTEPRYVVEDVSSGDFVGAFFSGGEAVAEADRLCVAAGACPECAGRGRIGHDRKGDPARSQVCPTCGGSGRDDDGSP